MPATRVKAPSPLGDTATSLSPTDTRPFLASGPPGMRRVKTTLPSFSVHCAPTPHRESLSWASSSPLVFGERYSVWAS